MLDSSDPLRFAVAKEELAMTLSNEDFDHKPVPVPILFLANKVDLSGLSRAVICTSCKKALGLDEFHDRRWQIYSSNALTGEGLTEAMDWFNDEMKKCMSRNKLVT